MTKNNGTHISTQQQHHEEVVALKDKVADVRVELVGVQLVHELTKRIEELTAQRQNYITQANMEINHQVGVYDGQIAEIKHVIEMLTPKPPANGIGAAGEKSVQADVSSNGNLADGNVKE